jgi:ubiquinone/menaquinone biosynthesis C-methylase UbiE
MQPLYDTIGTRYGNYRRPDPRIATALNAELGQAVSIVNIGAGVGSYEPQDRELVAVEPSQMMISQRAKNGAPIVQARAESLPFKDDAFEAAMAILTIHHWSDIEREVSLKRGASPRAESCS